MDEDDFRALIALTQRELRAAGAGALADPELYVERDAETGEPRRLPAQKQLIAMLLAFDRFVAVRDRETFEEARELINTSLSDGELVDVVVVASGEEGEGRTRSLAESPALHDVRRALGRLIAALSESGGGYAPLTA